MTEGSTLRHRIETDRESVRQDLARLVLTIIKLLHELMERQAIRRVDEGELSDPPGRRARSVPDAPRRGDD